MNRPWSPTRVTMPPPSVPGFIVTCSRIVLWRPITRRDFSPRYFKSWGSRPIEAKGKMRVFSPIVVRHNLDDQGAQHDRTDREMALEILLVDRDVLDAGGAHIGHCVNNLVDHQKRVAVRDHFHDPLNIVLDGLFLGEGRIDHHPFFFLARRCRIATCFINEAIGTAGMPQTVSPDATSRISPALAAMRAPL